MDTTLKERIAIDEMKEWPLNNLPDDLAHVLWAISPDIDFLDLTHPLRAAAASGGVDVSA